MSNIAFGTAFTSQSDIPIGEHINFSPLKIIAVITNKIRQQFMKSKVILNIHINQNTPLKL